MPVGLRFQRKHRKLGYLIKFIYYSMFRRDILEKKKSYGDKNPNETIYIIKPDYQDGVEGLLSLIYRQMIYIEYAESKGYIPFVDWKNFKTQYSDGDNNAWDFFFKQPSTITLEEIYSSKNVILSGWRIKDINSKGLFSAEVFSNDLIRNECSDIFERHLVLSDEMINIIDNESTRIAFNECIGVYIRGTDYVRLRPSGEHIQPSVEQLIPVIKEFQIKYNCDSIFLVTEDGDIYDELFAEFGQKIKIVSFDTFIRDYDGTNVLSKSNVLNNNLKRRGQDYLAKMVLLSKCRYLISSITQGSKFSYILNGGKYEDKYIFDLGLY